MIKFKSCSKCDHGDLLLSQDIYGWYLKCLQCGHIVELVETPSKEKLSKRPSSNAQVAA